MNSSPENGTTFFEQRFTMDLNKLSQEDANKIKLLAYGRPQIVVEDNQGNLIMLGGKNGMDVSSGTISSGRAFGDRNGVSLEFTGREEVAFYTMVGNTDTPGTAAACLRLKATKAQKSLSTLPLTLHSRKRHKGNHSTGEKGGRVLPFFLSLYYRVRWYS